MSENQNRRVDPPTNFSEAKGYYWLEMMAKNTPVLKSFQELARTVCREYQYTKKPKQFTNLAKVAKALQDYIKLSVENYIIYLNGSQGFYVKDLLKEHNIDEMEWQKAASFALIDDKRKARKRKRKLKTAKSKSKRHGTTRQN